MEVAAFERDGRTMAEMPRLARWFVNRSSSRRSARRYAWLRADGALADRSVCLEIGAGNGEFARRVVDGMHPARFVATDLDARQIDAARRHLGRYYPAGIPATLELHVADMRALPFPDGAFDAVFAFTSIHHAGPVHRDFAEVPRALGEIDRVLRAGGVLVYEEFLHLERIRNWLTDHGYRIDRLRRRFRHEWVRSVRVGGGDSSPAAPETSPALSPPAPRDAFRP